MFDTIAKRSTKSRMKVKRALFTQHRHLLFSCYLRISQTTVIITSQGTWLYFELELSV